MVAPVLADPRSGRVKRLRRLTDRDGRAQSGRFLAEGGNAVREALAAHRSGRTTLVEVLLTHGVAARAADLVQAAREAAVPVTFASDQVMAALSETVTPQGIVAVVATLDLPLRQVVDARPDLLAVLADVRDPGNAGSVIRAADAAGAGGVVLAGDSVDVYNGKVVRSSAGGMFHLPITRSVEVADTVAMVRAAGMQVVVADASGSASLHDQDMRAVLSRPTAWVFGNEAWGVPDDVQRRADVIVRIPIYGQAESLNLASAATLCLYASAVALRPGEH